MEIDKAIIADDNLQVRRIKVLFDKIVHCHAR